MLQRWTSNDLERGPSLGTLFFVTENVIFPGSKNGRGDVQCFSAGRQAIFLGRPYVVRAFRYAFSYYPEQRLQIPTMVLG